MIWIMYDNILKKQSIVSMPSRGYLTWKSTTLGERMVNELIISLIIWMGQNIGTLTNIKLAAKYC